MLGHIILAAGAALTLSAPQPPDSLTDSAVLPINERVTETALSLDPTVCEAVLTLEFAFLAEGVDGATARASAEDAFLGGVMRGFADPDEFGDYGVLTPAALQAILDHLASC